MFSCNVAFHDTGPNHTDSTCPQELWRGLPNSSGKQYEIIANNGTSIFHFLSNGHAFGWGYSSDRAINFLVMPTANGSNIICSPVL